MQTVIKERSASVMSRRGWVAQAVLTGQVAAALVLVVTAAFFVRTLWNLNRASGGVDRTGVAYGDVLFFRSKGQLPRDRVPAIMDEALERLRNNPHIDSATLAIALPMVWGSPGWGFTRVPGYTLAPGEENVAYVQPVAPRFFETLRSPRGDRERAVCPALLHRQRSHRSAVQDRPEESDGANHWCGKEH